MKMKYSDLLDSRRIKPGKFTGKQIADCLKLAERDIKTAVRMADDDFDWAYSIAYNAMLQASRALMFSKGYRPCGEGQHASTIMFIRETLGREFGDDIDMMDIMRRKRNSTLYDTAGLISLRESSESVITARRFVERIRGIVAI